MAGKSDSLEAGFLNLLFKNVDYTLVGDAGGLRGSAVAGSLYFSLHTADPTDAGTQTSSEAAYTSYARVAVTRGAGFTLATNTIAPAADVTFPAGTGGAGTATHWGVGTDISGVGKLLYSGAISPTIVCGNGVTPKLTAGVMVTED